MMKAPAIDVAGRAGAAASAAPFMSRLWRTLLGALLLATTPGLASASASEFEEWPTASDRGPQSSKRIPWLRFSGDPSAPVLAAAPGQSVYAQEVVVLRERELSPRQRRLLRRAERQAKKAARLRAKAGSQEPRYATVVVPVVQVAPPARPRPVVIERPRPPVQVVRLEQEPEHEGCDGSEREQVEASEHVSELHMPVVIDVEGLSADVERQVERALRDVERTVERAGRDQERAERARERAERAMERAQRSRR